MIWTVRYMIVSSATNLASLCIVPGISFMYRRNKQGSSTEPCGTQDKTGHDSDTSPSRTTCRDLPEMKNPIQVVARWWSFSKSFWNALLIMSVWPFSFGVSVRSWMNWINWAVVQTFTKIYLTWAMFSYNVTLLTVLVISSITHVDSFARPYHLHNHRHRHIWKVTNPPSGILGRRIGI